MLRQHGRDPWLHGKHVVFGEHNTNASPVSTAIATRQGLLKSRRWLSNLRRRRRSSVSLPLGRTGRLWRPASGAQPLRLLHHDELAQCTEKYTISSQGGKYQIQQGLLRLKMATFCPDNPVKEFVQGVSAQLLRSNGLMVVNAVLVAIMVAIGASGRRYRHATVTRFLLLGATTLYLPVISYVASSIGKEYCNTTGLDVYCHGRLYVALLLIWTVLVQIVGTNTSAIVAVDDDDGQKLGPSIELLTRTVWTSYLVFYYSRHGFLTSDSADIRSDKFYNLLSKILIVLCILSIAKLALKFYAFEKAKRSFALGRNPRLVAGYMEQLQGESHRASQDELVPALLVMGEEKQKIEEMPHGYGIKEKINSLITLDRVWRMVIDNDSLLAPQPGLKDLCMSFALFKLLRRRFAKCHLAELGSKKAFKFVLDVLLNNGSPDRVFKVLADEVSFVRDSYYSSLPTSCFGRLLPILNIIVSLSIIIWCLLAGEIIVHYFKHSNHPHQIFCSPKTCMLPQYLKTHDNRLLLGNVLYNSLPTYSLLVAVILAEAWEIVAYLCSNWLKVTLVCSYVTHGSWQQSPRIQGLFGYVLKLRINSRKGMIDPMGQISLLAHPRPKICGCFCFSNSRVHLVKVPLEVKASIISMLKSNNGSLSKGTMSLRNSRIGSDILWACEGQGTSDVMLVWHVATGIFEARHAASASCSADKMTTRHLYRYCVYLMKAAPELLPDDKAWSKKLYKTVKKDIKHALTGGRRGKESVEHQNLIAMLNDRSEHDVVKRGVRLGKQLVDLVSNEDVGWGILARFWSEMILYIAPSDNLKAQKKAIASGTELLTLIWVLLNHAGVITRPDDISDAF